MSKARTVQQLFEEWLAVFYSVAGHDPLPERKLPEEVEEFLDAEPGTDHKLEEAADVMIVTLTELVAEGFTIEQAMNAIRTKLVTNIGRKWRRNGDGTISHVKDVSGKEVS